MVKLLPKGKLLQLPDLQWKTANNYGCWPMFTPSFAKYSWWVPSEIRRFTFLLSLTYLCGLQ